MRYIWEYTHSNLSFIHSLLVIRVVYKEAERRQALNSSLNSNKWTSFPIPKTWFPRVTVNTVKIIFNEHSCIGHHSHF
jgi:hypothetical protein